MSKNIAIEFRSNKQANIRSTRGFTLIEILVAMTIIAIAMAALIKASGDHTGSAAYLKQKTLAHYVAMNELNRLQVNRTWPDLGTDKQTVTMAGHDWPVTRETLETQDPETHAVRFTVYVDADQKQAVTHLQGYISQLNVAAANTPTPVGTPQ